MAHSYGRDEAPHPAPDILPLEDGAVQGMSGNPPHHEDGAVQGMSGTLLWS